MDSGLPKKLHLGVVDLPYRSNSRKSGAMMTSDVAQILEAKYHVMQTFYDMHEADIGKAMEESFQGALETLISSRQAVDPFGSAMQTIEHKFRDFIALGEMENMGLKGIPTAAALAGVNHRLKHPYAKKNPRRPSFRDTGLYSASFRAFMGD